MNFFRLHVLESENMRMSTLIRTTNRQVCSQKKCSRKYCFKFRSLQGWREAERDWAAAWSWFREWGALPWGGGEEPGVLHLDHTAGFWGGVESFTLRWWSSIRRWRPSRSPSSRWCRRSLMGKGRRRPSSSWWRWISKGRRRGAGSSLSRLCGRSCGVIVGGRQIFLQRIQEEEGDILHLGVPRPRQRTEVEEDENQPFTKNSTSQKWKCGQNVQSHGCPT